MKVTNRVLTTAGLLLMGAAGLSAQNLKADIPFNFYIGNTKLAAGTYHVLRADEMQTRQIYRFRNASTGNSKSAAMPIPVTMDSPNVKDSRLIFRCAQGECELYEIWSAHNGMKVRAGRSKRFDAVNTEIATVLLTNGM